MSTMPTLTLQCFGPPTALVDGKAPPPVATWKKNFGMLVYLALSPSRARTREHLRGLFWPEKDDDYARRSLNEAVRLLRRDLGAERLLSNGNSLEINPSGLMVDALDPNLLPSAVFLEGFNVDGCQEFEGWVSNQRERIRSRVIATLIQIGDRKLEDNRFDEAREIAHKALGLDSLSEPATRLLMLAQGLSGDVDGAKATHRNYLARYREAGGDKPSAALAAVMKQLEDLDPVIPVRDREPRLVGHLESHRQVMETAGEVPKQGARTVLISGAPGMGRTRLLDECAKRFKGTTRAAAAIARPLANDADTAWSALRLLLRSGLAQAPGLIGAAPGSLGILAAIAPDLGIRGKPVEPRDVGEVAAALRDLLGAIAREQPVMIGIDDVQFADKATLGALLGAMENLRSDRVLLGLSVPEMLGQSSLEMLRLRQEIGRRLQGVAVRLKPLSLEAIAELTAELAPWCTDPATRQTLVERLHRESEGNPFYAVTLLRAIATPNSLRGDLCSREQLNSMSSTLPENIKTAVTSRVVELEKAAQSVVAAATIGGPVFDLELIGFLTSLDRATIENALAAAERRHLVVFQNNRYIFAAPIVNDVISQESLVRGERQAMRRRAIEFLGGRTDLESRVTRVELLSKLDPGTASFDAAIGLAREAKAAGAEHAAFRAVTAAKRSAGTDPGPEQRRQLDDLSS